MTPPTTGRQRSIRRAIPTIKRRKYAKTPNIATPDRRSRNDGYASYEKTPVCNEVRIFPLRAILDDRVKRRIRRNGLSEEMNTIYSERKQRNQKTVEEMERLRVRLADKEQENDMLREQSSLLQDTSRIEELEREISDLRQGFHRDDFSKLDDDWDMAAADGFTDGDSTSDLDDRFRDDTTLEVESAGSGYHSKETTYVDALKSFTPPNTSPPRVASPDSPRHLLSVPRCDVGVQTTSGEATQALLEEELTQLRHEILSLQKTLEAREELETRTANDIPTENGNNTGNIDADLQLQADIMLQTLAEKTEALTSLNSLISTLGSPGSDASKIVSTLKDAFHCARQELEQIFPDETSTNTSFEGAAVLQSMVQHLRESAAQAKGHEALLETYCNREQHLHEQLDDRMKAMDAMNSKLRDKDDRVFKLEAELERSGMVIDDYRKDVAKARHDLEQNNAEMIDIQANLGSMISVTTDLQAQLAQLQVDKEVELAACKSTYDAELKMRDARLEELNEEIGALKDALTLAHESISKLQCENERLQGVADRDKKAARDTVAALRTQLLQSLQTSEAFLA